MARATSKPRKQESKTYKLIQLVGTSPVSYEEAVRHAVRDAQKTLRGLAWFEVEELRGQVRDDDELEFQAKINIGFRVLDQDRP